MDLDSRAQSLLKSLITHHIDDGQPVGSKTLSASSDLDLSPASIRNIMKDLEDAGFVSSPHTSSARIPTNKGYRLFVDSLVTVQSLDDVEISSLKNQLIASDNKHLISSAANTLSELTKFAGIVMIPKAKKIKYKHIEFIGISERRVLVIIITDDGNVQNSVLYTNHDYHKTSLTEAANYFNKEFSGYSVEEAKKRLMDDLKHMKTNISDLMSSAINSAADNNDEADSNEDLEQTIAIAEEFMKQTESIADHCFGIMHTLDNLEIRGLWIFNDADPERLFGVNEDSSWFTFNQLGPEANEYVKKATADLLVPKDNKLDSKTIKHSQVL